MNWEDVGMSAGRWALTNSAGAAVIAILVFIVQTLLGDRISPRWRHNLWLLVVVRLVLPALPGIRLPLPHFPHETAQTSRAIVSTEAPKDLRSATTKVFHSLEESEHPAVADSLPVETAVSEGHSSEAAPVGKDEIVIPSVPTSVSAKRIS